MSTDIPAANRLRFSNGLVDYRDASVTASDTHTTGQQRPTVSLGVVYFNRREIAATVVSSYYVEEAVHGHHSCVASAQCHVAYWGPLQNK